MSRYKITYSKSSGIFSTRWYCYVFDRKTNKEYLGLGNSKKEAKDEAWDKMWEDKNNNYEESSSSSSYNESDGKDYSVIFGIVVGPFAGWLLGIVFGYIFGFFIGIIKSCTESEVGDPNLHIITDTASLISKIGSYSLAFLGLIFSIVLLKELIEKK